LSCHLAREREQFADGAGSGTMTRMGPSSEDPSGVRSDDSKDQGRPPDDRDPEGEMDALVSSAAVPAAPTGASDRTESSSAAAKAAASVDRTEEEARELEAAKQRRDPESEMAALMGSSDATPDPQLHRVATPAVTRRRAVGLDDELFEAPARTIVRIRRPIDDGAAPRERVPQQQRVVAPPLPPALRRNRDGQPRRPPSLLWAVVAGVAVAGAIVLVQRQLASSPAATVASKTGREPSALEMPRVRESTNARTQATTAAQSQDVEPEPSVPTTELTPRDTSANEVAPVKEPEAALAKNDAEPAPKTTVEPTKPVDPRPDKPRETTNPRTPPRGTPADVAAVFTKLPVSPADLPPVGGIGRSGIHVDRIEMGSTYEKGLCGGIPDKFSLAKLERVNVCLRVVHPREEETVSIVWQKNDLGTARRGKIAIKPLHAYRTRAYLVLRKEYVGDWTVRILSGEGVELAAHRFTIVP
jgi:hypothetical protein